MAAVAVGQGRSSISTNHLCNSVTTTDRCSSDVLAEGIGIVRNSDRSKTHLIPRGDSCGTHTPTIIANSSVIVNGRPAAKVGDRHGDCGSITTGITSVDIGR